MNFIREYRESRIQNEREDYPVLLVEDVNHGQVASGTYNAELKTEP